MSAWVFDQPHAVRITEARQDFLRGCIPCLRPAFDLRTALDLGCGVGYFSGFLQGMGFHVTGVDGRAENVEEAKKRFADPTFVVGNIEDPRLSQLGTFDLVLCFGLLYHLENPFRALRNLHSLTTKLALIESICVPDSRPVLYLRREGKTEDQGLNFVAFYPSEGCLVNLLYQVGFESVYGFKQLPEHEDFRATLRYRKHRTVLCASKMPLTFDSLFSMPQTLDSYVRWETGWGRVWHQAERLLRLGPRHGRPNSLRPADTLATLPVTTRYKRDIKK